MESLVSWSWAGLEAQERVYSPGLLNTAAIDVWVWTILRGGAISLAMTH